MVIGDDRRWDIYNFDKKRANPKAVPGRLIMLDCLAMTEGTRHAIQRTGHETPTQVLRKCSKEASHLQRVPWIFALAGNLNLLFSHIGAQQFQPCKERSSWSCRIIQIMNHLLYPAYSWENGCQSTLPNHASLLSESMTKSPQQAKTVNAPKRNHTKEPK